MPTATPVPATAEQLAAVRFDGDGLVPVVCQEQSTGDVLMVAWMNAETLRLTLSTGRMTYWSRSRQEVWVKGETSGERQWVREASYDCDGDTLLFKVEQEGGGACHTGAHTCFFRRFGPGPERPLGAGNTGPERPFGAGNTGPERPLGAGM